LPSPPNFLENRVVPTYEILYTFLQSDKDIIACATQNPSLLSDHLVYHNITVVLIENGVIDSSVSRLLRAQGNSTQPVFLKVLEELKDLGFNSSQSFFSIAFHAKRTVTKTK